MTNEQIRKILDDDYDPSRENLVLSMIKDFYSRKMLSIVILVWVWAILFCAGAVYCGIQFMHADQTKSQIMYAALFIVFVEGVALMKIFAWQMIVKNAVSREIKRLELRVAELAKSQVEKS